MARRIISILMCLSFIFQQTGFAQAATVELNLAGHLARLNNSLTLATFRPVHLRYFSYDLPSNTFKVLLDKGSEKDLSQAKLENSTKELLKYFLIGVTLPDNTFWVNLRPDSPDQIIEDVLTKTDIGKIMLETDLQLKKDTAAFTSPQTIEGKEYWDKLYKKAEELYGTDTVTIPTITRPWIVPNEVIVREAEGSAYIYKATLKVMLEADYIKSSNTHLNTVDYSFKDKRSKALNEYSTQLIRELIIPKLTKEVNTSKNYAALRQVFYSLVLSRWFKLRFAGKTGTYPSLIDKQDLTNLTSTQSWDKSTYFNQYKKSFAQGEYNIKETHYTPTGQVIRSYFSGGVQMIIPQNGLGGGADISGNLTHTLELRTGKAGDPTLISSPIKGNVSSPVSAPQESITSLVQYRDSQYLSAVGSEGTADMLPNAAVYSVAEGKFYPGKIAFDTLVKEGKALIATNIVSYSQIRGHMLAAMQKRAALILEGARSQLFDYALDVDKMVSYIKEIAAEINCDIPIILHGDHIQYAEKFFTQKAVRAVLEDEYKKALGQDSQFKPGMAEELNPSILQAMQDRLHKDAMKEREVIRGMNETLIKAGFTSIAIDASTIFDEYAGDLVIKFYKTKGSAAEKLVVALEEGFSLPLEWGTRLLKLDLGNSRKDRKELESLKVKISVDMELRGVGKKDIAAKLKEIDETAGILRKAADEKGLNEDEVIAAYDKVMYDVAQATIAGKMPEGIRLTKEQKLLLLPTNNAEETAYQLAEIDKMVAKFAPDLRGKFGIEVEVGHVDKKAPNPKRKDAQGKPVMEAKMTHPMAVRVMGEYLRNKGLAFQLIATNNGSGHGTDFDSVTLTPVSQVGKISPYLTKELQAEAVKLGASIAQHGTSGSDMLELAELSQSGVIKFNVATNYQQIIMNVLALMDQGMQGDVLLDYVSANKDALVAGLSEQSRSRMLAFVNELLTGKATAEIDESKDSLFIQFLKHGYAWGLKKNKVSSIDAIAANISALQAETAQMLEQLNLLESLSEQSKLNKGVKDAIGALNKVLAKEAVKRPMGKMDPKLRELGQASSAMEASEMQFAEAYANPQLRLEQINKGMLPMIEREIKQPSSGNLPEVVYIADYHGEIRLFVDYIADAISQKINKKVTLDYRKLPAVSIDEQLKSQDVDITKVNVTFYLLGDLLDRGKYGVKCFFAAKELIELGVARYVTGNHDLWAFLNLMGYHLPVYSGYNFYGHKESQDLVGKHWNDPEIAKHRIGWWTSKLAEYNAAQKKFQKDTLNIALKEDGSTIVRERSIADIREHLKAHYLQYKKHGIKLTPEETKLWEDLVGLYFGSTDVYTGFNGIGMMSEQWWQEKLKTVERMLDAARGSEDVYAVSTWETLKEHVEAATNEVSQRLHKAISIENKWYWQVFNDMNHQNYTSVEWWGKDWSSHSGWGTAVIDELNELEREKGSDKVWTQENYINNPYLQDLANFYRKYFNLFLKDAYGNVSTHGWLPIDKEGQVRFTYKGTTYEGVQVWEGLRVISDDISDMSKPLSELHEALSLVNSWYADATTVIKPKNVANYVNKIGLEKIYQNLGIKTWLTCHNPLNKLHPLGVEFLVNQNGNIHVTIDNGMSFEKFLGLGGYARINNRGIVLRSYKDTTFDKIIDNPPTVLLKKDKQHGFVTKESWPNASFEGKEYLESMRSQLITEAERLSPASSPVSAPQESITSLVQYRDSQYLSAVGSEGTADMLPNAAVYSVAEGKFYPGKIAFDTLVKEGKALIATNIVSYSQIRGHMLAAMQKRAALILEGARSQLFDYALDVDKMVSYIKEIAAEINCDIPIILHGDHIQYAEKFFTQKAVRAVLEDEYKKALGQDSQFKPGMAEELNPSILQAMQDRLHKDAMKEREVIRGMNETLIKAGFTSIAIDASTIFDEYAGDLVIKFYKTKGSAAEKLVVALEEGFSLPLEWGTRLLKLDLGNSRKDRKELESLKVKISVDMELRGVGKKDIAAKLKEIDETAGILRKAADEKGLNEDEVIAAYDKVMYDVAQATIAGKMPEGIRLTKEQKLLLLPTNNAEETAYQLAEIDKMVAKFAPDLRGKFGIEVEVGHVDKKAPNPKRKDAQGKPVMEAKMTHPMAVRVMGEYLRNKGLAFQLIATNNGSGHGTDFDSVTLTPVSQVGKISPYLTKELQAEAVKLGASIAQHGTSGSDMLELAELSQSGVIKFNVATNYQQIIMNVLALMDQGMQGDVLLDYVSANKDALVAGLSEQSRSRMLAFVNELLTGKATAEIDESKDSLFIQFLKHGYAWGLKKNKVSSIDAIAANISALQAETAQMLEQLNLLESLSEQSKLNKGVKDAIGALNKVLAKEAVKRPMGKMDPKLRELGQASSAVEASKPKVAINGFGRIGKLVLKAYLENPDNKFDIVAVNDLAPIETLAHLFKYDSTFGTFKGDVNILEGNILEINGKQIKVFSERDPSQLPWAKLGVEIVIEASGKFRDKEGASKHLAAGAKRVVLTAPGKGSVDFTAVLGVNQDSYEPDQHQIISNASCTTNALAPVVKILHGKFGIKSGTMFTVHAATNDQGVLDMGHSDLRRARATLGNMIPTTTGAARAVGLVIPELQGRLNGIAMRVPTANVSAIYLSLVLENNTTAEEVNAALKEAAEEGPLSRYIGYTTEELVSSDFLRSSKSGTVDASLTEVVKGNHLQLVIWYDNEWGYSLRTVGLLNFMIEQEAPKARQAASSAVEAADLESVVAKAKRTPVVGGNWKMSITSTAQAESLLIQIAEKFQDTQNVEIILAPSYVHLPYISAALKRLEDLGQIPKGAIKIAAQNVAAKDQGALTGRISVLQLGDFYGVKYVIVGHSEQRRGRDGESIAEPNEIINQKARLVIDSKRVPIVCVGETAKERKEGRTKEIIEEQVRGSLENIAAKNGTEFIIAYEPVWAIGTGVTATTEQAQEVHSFIRGILADMYGQEVAAKVRIQYGGSVTPDNAQSLMSELDIDGALVGGASLKADQFAAILEGAVNARPQIEARQKIGAILRDLYFGECYREPYTGMKNYAETVNNLFTSFGIRDHSMVNFARRPTIIEHAREISQAITNLRGILEDNLGEFKADDKIYKKLGDMQGELEKAILIISGSEVTASSPLASKKGNPGGIDFRKQAMASVTAYKPMGTFIGLDAKLPEMSKSALAKFDLDKVASHIESMLSAKILFDETIIMEYMAASIAKGELAKRKSDVVTWLAKLGMLQEELDCCQESSPQYRKALVLVEKYAAI